VARECPVHYEFDPLSQEHLADPYTVLAALPLDEAPVFYAPSIDCYVVTRYADIEFVFRDTDTYSAAIALAPLIPPAPETQRILLDGPHQQPMVSLDEPGHARQRKPTIRVFSAKRVNDMIPAIKAATTLLLDAVGVAAEFDLIAALARPLPVGIIFRLMGVPDSDYRQLTQWSGYRATLSWGQPALADQIKIATSIVTERRYFRDLVDAKMGQPGDDLTSDLLAVHREDPDRFTLDEIATILFALAFAGHETTTGLIGNTLHRLLEDPERWEQVARQPELVSVAVEETLRYDPPISVWRRITTRPAQLGGASLPAGARLFLWLAAAGRDPSVFPDPDRFDLHRPNSGQHLAFGKGLHHCLGASLARLEAQLAIEELIRRYPRLRLADHQQFSFHPTVSVRCLRALLVRAG
jgi:cytochrome P450